MWAGAAATDRPVPRTRLILVLAASALVLLSVGVIFFVLP